MSSDTSDDSMSVMSNPITPNTAATSLASTPAKDIALEIHNGTPESRITQKTVDNPNSNLDGSPGPNSESTRADKDDDLNNPDPDTHEPVNAPNPIDSDTPAGNQGGAGAHPHHEDEGELSDGSSLEWYPSVNISMPDKAVIQKSKKRLAQHIHYTKLEAVRLSRLESRLDALEKREPSPEPKPDETTQRKPAIPTPNLVEWTEFKKLQLRGDTHHAIDVLVGEPILFHQYQKNAAIAVASKQTKIPTVNVERQLRDFPERIRINSIPLLKILRNIAGNAFRDIEDRPIVVLRPYKPLLYHLKDLQDTLNSLNDKWGVSLESLGAASAADSVDPAPSGTESTDGDDSKTLEPREEVSTFVAELHESAEARDDLQCLVRFLEDRVEHINKRLKEKKPRVYFHDLWHIFKPGTLVSIRDTPDMVWKVLQATGGRNFLSASGYVNMGGPNLVKGSPFYLDCYYIDYDGQNFGPVQNKFQIKHFDGERDISSLSIYPVQYADSYAEDLNELTSRGERFVEASKVQHMYCKGRTLVRTPSGVRMVKVNHSEDLDSPVMIDFDRALQFNPDWKPSLGFEEPQEQSSFETKEMTLKAYITCNDRGNCTDEYCCMNDNIIHDYQWDRQRMNEFVEEREKAIRNKPQTAQGPSGKIPSDEWKLLPNRVFGFILRSRKWGSMRLVPDLSPVKKDASGLKLLELPKDHENIINSLVEIHFKNREAEKDNPTKEQFNFDPVRAKGKGLILLLHGAPGVGKTSTAECIAQSNGKPLFPITCGDLGMTPKEVDNNLETNFQLAQSWDCVLLLDEADVFLAERAKADVERNALVSVFLRALEYYTGVLFLTTNRVGTLDEAFKSRIHMSLLYPALTWEQTEAIWTKHLDRLAKRPDITVERKEVMEFARTEFDKQVKIHKFGWNGRQIRNAFQTAVALAEHDACRLASDADHPPKTDLRPQFFQDVAKAAVQFDDYLKKVYRESLADHVNQLKWRNDIYHGPSEAVAGSYEHQSSAKAQGSSWAQSHSNQHVGRQTPTPQWPAGNPNPPQNNIPGYGGPYSHNGNPQMQMPYNQGYVGNFNPNQGYAQPNNASQPDWNYGGQPPQQQNYPMTSGIPLAQGQQGGGGPYPQAVPGQQNGVPGIPPSQGYPLSGQPGVGNAQQPSNQYGQPGGVIPQQPNAQYGQSSGGNPRNSNNQYGQPGVGTPQSSHTE